MAEKHSSSKTNTSDSSSRGLKDVPATVIAMLTSLLLMAGLVATLNTLVFTQ